MVILSANGIQYLIDRKFFYCWCKSETNNKNIRQFELRWIMTKDIVILLAKNEKEEENM